MTEVIEVTELQEMTDATGMIDAPSVSESTVMANVTDVSMVDGAGAGAGLPPDMISTATIDAPDTLGMLPEAHVSEADARAFAVAPQAEPRAPEVAELAPWRGRSTDLDPRSETPAPVDGLSAAPVIDAEAAHVGDQTRGPSAEDGAAVGEPTRLVETLLETAAPRRKKRRPADGQPERGDLAPPAYASRTNGDHAAVGAAAIDTMTAALTPPAGTPVDELDDAAWREQWPANDVHIVGRLLPRVSDAPALDGVQRTRMELALVEQIGDAFGTMGTLPIFVMPGAPGFAPILNEIQRARKQKRRLEPIMVEIRGVLRQMPDRDLRYASERYAVLMGVEAHQVKRVARDAEQFAYWRGRAEVVAHRRYAHRDLPYRRVTAVVELRQRKPRLRGASITHIPVDFLVAPGHEHADRFKHVGQRLLIEATIGADVYHLREDHPALEGIDDPRRKAQLQILRESVVTVTLGEFPDEAAERDYRRWVKAGRPWGPRAGAPARPGGPAQSRQPGPAPYPQEPQSAQVEGAQPEPERRQARQATHADGEA